MAEKYVPDERKGKTPEEQLRKEEPGNLPEKKIGLMTVKMIQDLRRRKEAETMKIQETFDSEMI